MKTLFVSLFLFISGTGLIAQTKDVEAHIRDLEQKEVQAVLQKDTVTLRKMWASDFTVNSPLGTIVPGGKNTLDRPVITRLNYQRFERNTESILVKGDIAISMGNELVINKDQNGTQGRIIKRRYTNVWMKQDNVWKMIARHANEICR